MKVLKRSSIRVSVVLLIAATFALRTSGQSDGYPMSDLSDMQFVLRHWQSLLLPQTKTNWYDVGYMTFLPTYGDMTDAVSEAMPLATGRTLLFVSEDGATHDTIIRDMAGVVVAAVPPEANYSPAWAYEDAVARGDVAAGSPAEGYDPTRVGVRLTLVQDPSEPTSRTLGDTTGWSQESNMSADTARQLVDGKATVVAGNDEAVAGDGNEAERTDTIPSRLSTNTAVRAFVPTLIPRVQRSVRHEAAVLRTGGGDGTGIEGEVQAETVRTREITCLPDYGSDAVLYYDFAEEPVDGHVLDCSTNGYDGAVADCCWTNAGRFAGGAMVFDSNDDSINAGYDLDFPSWERYSVSLWFLHDGGGDMGPQYGQKMIDKTSYYHDWHLSIHPVGHGNDTGGISLSLYEEGPGGGMGDASRNYGDGQWHHVAVVRDGANGQFWVDGVLKDTSTNMVSVFSYSPLCIGNSYSDDGFQRKGWSGLLDEIRIFNRPIEAAEVAELHANGTVQMADVHFRAGVVVHGDLSVTGKVHMTGGAYLRPLGDLSSGIYTNGVPPRAD